MDFERATSLAAEKRAFEQKVKQFEPIDPVEGLTPQERFTEITRRIEGLPTETYAFESSRRLRLELEDNISLELYACYPGTSAPRETSSPYVIGASWKVGERFSDNPKLAHEQLWAKDLNDPDAPRVLGLLEESVTVAEEEFARRSNLEGSAAQNPQS